MSLIVDDALDLLGGENCSFSAIGCGVRDLEWRKSADTDFGRAREPVDIVVKIFGCAIVVEFSNECVNTDSFAENGIFLAVTCEELGEDHEVFIRVSCFAHEVLSDDEWRAVCVVQSETVEDARHELYVLFHTGPQQRRVLLRFTVT